MTHDRHVHSTHPLKMGFTRYLQSMDDSRLDERLGKDRAEAFRMGMLDTSHYLSAPRGEKYGIDRLRADDDASFAVTDK